MSTPQPPMIAPRVLGSLRKARRYDRGFDWTYAAPPPGPEATSGALLVPIIWDGLPLNTGDDPATGLCIVVEQVTGWLDSPPLNGNDAARVISDGAAWGPKTLGARIVTITGVAIGPRDQLGAFRDQLGARAAARQPASLSITDGGTERTLTALVRADTDAWKQTWVTPTCYRYQFSVTAADPVLYDDTWQQATLDLSLGSTGRVYQRTYGWSYGSPFLPNSALLQNDGNWPTPVYCLYSGDLSSSTLADEAGNSILFAAVGAGMQIWLDTSTLTAQAAGGLSRASYVLPGSVPMTIEPASTERWHLYASGGGSVALAWRSAWV
jgi:hypothetical protein